MMGTQSDDLPRGAAVRRPLVDRGLLIVGLTFAAAYTVLMFAVGVVSSRGGWSGLSRITASISNWLITAIGLDATSSGIYIHLSNRTLSIDTACTAVFIMAVYAALVIAYPVRMRMRLVGLLVGLPVIFAFNIARIAGVAVVSVYATDYFTFVHDYVFEVFMVLVALVTWAVWLSFVQKHAR